MFTCKIPWNGLSQFRNLLRSPQLALVNRLQILQSRWATSSPDMKVHLRPRKRHDIQSKRNSLPLIAEVNGVGSTLQNANSDVEQRLREIDDQLEKLKDDEDMYKVFVSDVQRQIEDTYSKIKESLGDERFDELKERINAAEKRRKKLRRGKDEPQETEYGSPDPSVPISDVPCHGCGALLHCQDQNIQGYIPSEKFIPLTSAELNETLCQRCHLLKYHNVCLNIRMDPTEFERTIQEIRPKVALVIVIVDLLDMPNCIISDLLDMIGRKHHVYIVGNKVDLLPNDGRAFLERVLDCLKKCCADQGLEGKCIKHTCLVSAKTGYGIEGLVTKLFNRWDRKGDVYLLGSTNVGKSSLFNALLSSDYCRSRARELISRATASVWPGTTLSLLKFPIARPSRKGLYLRTQRLIKTRDEQAEEARKARMEREVDKLPKERWKSLIGYIGTTVNYSPEVKAESFWDPGLHPGLISFDMSEDEIGMSEFNQEELHRRLLRQQTEDVFENAKWCYDTPGVIQPSQVINYLTQRELCHLILSRSLLIPRTFILHPGKSLFVGGLGRIDCIQVDTSILMTVHSALPVFVVATEKADEFYENNVDRGMFKVPVRKSDRLPPLTSKDFTITGVKWKESAADIVLSSAGWVSVTTGYGQVTSLRCFTPGAKGLCLREPSLLSKSVNQRGKRVKGSPMYEVRE